MTALTRIRAGSNKPVPLRAHGVVELLVGPALLVIGLAAAWGAAARIFFAAAGREAGHRARRALPVALD